MTEPKRATWGNFLRWVVAERAGHCPGPTYGLRAAADYVSSEREAIGALMGCGVRPLFIDGIIDDWRDVLESQVISHPVDPPSVAEVLESVAGEISDAGKTFCADLSGEDARRLRLAFGCAVAIVRAKAKEFA